MIKVTKVGSKCLYRAGKDHKSLLKTIKYLLNTAEQKRRTVFARV
jgi:hypothetical protein